MFCDAVNTVVWGLPPDTFRTSIVTKNTKKNNQAGRILVPRHVSLWISDLHLNSQQTSLRCQEFTASRAPPNAVKRFHSVRIRANNASFDPQPKAQAPRTAAWHTNASCLLLPFSSNCHWCVSFNERRHRARLRLRPFGCGSNGPCSEPRGCGRRRALTGNPKSLHGVERGCSGARSS